MTLNTRKHASSDQLLKECGQEKFLLLHNILSNTQSPGIHAVTQTVAITKKKKKKLRYSCNSISLFPSEHGSNDHSLPVLRGTFNKVCQLHWANMNCSSLASDSQQDHQGCIYSRSMPGQQTSPCKLCHPFIQNKKFLPLSPSSGFYRKRYSFQTSCASPFILGTHFWT